MKYIKISIVILLVSFISIFAYKLTTNNSNNKISLTKEQMKEMLSYTIDGNSTSSMPTKGSGYKVKSITCKSGSILSWDNDNWLLEVEKLESEDLCNIDFTTGTGSYTVTAVPSIAGHLDSTSKTTTENGTVTFYTDAIIDSVSGCTNEISDGKVTIKNVTSNTTCNINVSFIKLYDRLLADNPTRSTRVTYDTTFTSNTPKTLYKATENGMGVYYFAGLDATRSGVGSCQITSEDYGFEFSTKEGSDYKIVYAKTIAEAETLLESWTEIFLTENECKTENICLITSGEYWAAVLGVSEEDCSENGIEYNPVVNREWKFKDVVFNQDSTLINNWVKFGKNSSNQDLYWRIIRTNSDGGVRLLYHGTSTTATDAYIGTSAFNSSYNDIAYVSYMYGSSGSIANARTNQTNSSTIKTTIDNWYTSNLEAKGYTKYLSTTAVYCNDRSTSDNTYFGAYTRLKTNKTPSYDCAATEDKFTADTSTGNGKLTYPIALMTADEVSFAGGLYGTNAPTWYYYNSANGSSTGLTWWWLLSPGNWDGSYAYVFFVVGSSNPGFLSSTYVSHTYGVRPAVSLKSCVKTSGGDGSASAPYTIEETSSGC